MDDGLNRAVATAMRKAAEQAIIPRFVQGQALVAEYKSLDEAVTVADRESEAILAENLSNLIPGALIIGEEASHYNPSLLSQLASGTCWVIDPLDGTANFAAGTSPFGILVALAQDGIPVGGWILDPLTGRFCAAQAGKGASIDAQAFSIPSLSRTRPLVAVTKLFSNAANRERLLATLSRHCDVLDSPRCAADQYPRIACGDNDATVFTRTLAWDHAAGVIFLNEAGGLAARPDGTPYRCADEYAGLIAATNSSRWEEVARQISDSGIMIAGASIPDDSIMANAS